MPKPTITPEDFDKATTQPWTPCTCLVAQAGIRQDIPARPDSAFSTKSKAYGLTSRSPKARQIMFDFDRNYAWTEYCPEKFEEARKSTKMLAIRASLPITLTDYGA